MPTREQFCLSFALDFIAFKMNVISIRKRIVDMAAANNVTCTRENAFTRVVIQFFMTRHYTLNNRDVI